MKSEVKKIDKIKREITISADGEIIKNKFEDVYKSIGKTAKVSGFRQGHIPRDILEKNYASLAHEQVMRELIPDLYKDAVSEHALDVVELPEISEVALDHSRIAFKATVSVTPEIALKDYRGMKVTYTKVTVTPEDVKRMLDSVKESRKAETIDDAFARGLGYPDLATLESFMEKQIYTQKLNQQRQHIESELIETLIKDMKFPLPASLVERQMQELLRQTKLDLALKGMSREDIEAKEKEIRADLEPQARKQVIVYLVLSSIAKKENIPQDDQMTQKALAFLLREATWQEKK